MNLGKRIVFATAVFNILIFALLGLVALANQLWLWTFTFWATGILFTYISAKLINTWDTWRNQ